MFPKNRSSALMALLAAGGLYAWRNRDKIQGWLSQQNIPGRLADSGLSTGTSYPATGATRRIDDTSAADNTSYEQPYGSGI